jgi:hypothetical protein
VTEISCSFLHPKEHLEAHNLLVIVKKFGTSRVLSGHFPVRGDKRKECPIGRSSDMKVNFGNHFPAFRGERIESTQQVPCGVSYLNHVGAR